MNKLKGYLSDDMHITPHLTVAEYACRCGCELGRHGADIVWEIVNDWEEIRRRGGDYPFNLSGCRCETHNAEVGGAADSAHLRRSALDTMPVGGWIAYKKATGHTRQDFVKICEDIIQDGGVGSKKYGDNGLVHIDRDRKLIAINPFRRW